MLATELPTVHPGSPNVRLRDPRTSHEAADLTDEHRSIGLVLALLKEGGPMPDHEIEVAQSTKGEQFSGQRLRTARAALVEAGLVEATDEEAFTPRRRRTTVWRAAA
jgi:hypothetical protein